MKLSPIFALLTLSAPVIAHAQSADAPDVAATAALPLAPKSAATSDAFVWRFMPSVGSHWTMRSFARATSITKTPAMNGQKSQQFKFVSIQKMTADYDVLNRDALGATTIRLTVREMTNDVTSMADGKNMGSPFPYKADPKAVNGATLTIKQSSDGKVWGVVGMRAFQRKLLQSSGMLDAADIEQVLNAMPTNGDNGMLKSLGQVSGGFPTSPVRVVESWNYNMSLPVGLPVSLAITGTRTLKTLDSDVAVVAESARLGGSSQPQPPVAGATNMPAVYFSRLTGTVSGTTRVQRSSGLPLEATANLSLSGSVSTQTPASEVVSAKTVTVPMDLTTATRVILEPR